MKLWQNRFGAQQKKTKLRVWTLNNAANDTNNDEDTDGNHDDDDDHDDDAFVHSIKCHTIYKQKSDGLGVIFILGALPDVDVEYIYFK